MTKEKDDLKFTTDNAGKVYKTLADFKTRNQKTLDEWQNLETAWEAHKVGIADIADDIEENGLLYENDQLEVWKKDSRITIMPKDRYQNQ